MTHLVAISPHLDDAAFSVGGMLAAHARDGGRVTVVTCFTANVASPPGFALACQRDKGLADDVDYMALRRAEDRAACAVIGATPVHLPLLEAPHRGYASAPELFGARRCDDRVLPLLCDMLTAQLQALRPDLLLGPMAIGNHVDHWLVRDALDATGAPVLRWEDWPYLRREGRRTEAATRVHRLSDADRSARLLMCAAYATQIDYQFGALGALQNASEEIEEEQLF